MVKKEIGSEFWDVPMAEKKNGLFPKCTQWYLSGRSALQAIIAELGDIRSVSLPSWCCDSMVKPFAEVGVNINFYKAAVENNALVQKIEYDSDVLFLMDYFGYTAPAPDVSGFKGIIIRDVTHSIFSASYSDADYYFGSLRKWCGVWTAGYAWTNDGHPLPIKQNDDLGYTLLRDKAMQLKNSYIHGLGVTDKGYLQFFDEAEEILEKVGIVSAADRDVMLASKLDVEYIRQRRRVNAEVLRSAFADWLIFSEKKESDCPMFVPVLVPNGKRDELRRFLISNNIYCPIHWPVSEYHRLTKQEKFLYENELSLVCDQRYTEDDMRRVVQIIKSFTEE